jgi:hypothetical protein
MVYHIENWRCVQGLLQAVPYSEWHLGIQSFSPHMKCLRHENDCSASLIQNVVKKERKKYILNNIHVNSTVHLLM